MRKLIICSVLSAFGTASASTVTVVGPCDAKPILRTQTTSKAPTLGDLTVEVLQQNHLSFEGSRAGIKSIQKSPVGDDAIEVLSKTRLRAYGWCFEINGQQPAVMPDAVKLHGSANNIVWFYAYSTYDSGVWKDYCTPSYKVKSLPSCRH